MGLSREATVLILQFNNTLCTVNSLPRTALVYLPNLFKEVAYVPHIIMLYFQTFFFISIFRKIILQKKEKSYSCQYWTMTNPRSCVDEQNNKNNYEQEIWLQPTLWQVNFSKHWLYQHSLFVVIFNHFCTDSSLHLSPRSWLSTCQNLSRSPL